MRTPTSIPMDDELQMLEVKLKQLKLEYEQYFCGSRPREPAQTRSEIQKQVIQYQSTPIKNTAVRFRFNSINSRFQAWKRQWDNIIRQIEAGTYERHVFKANLHDRQRGQGKPPEAAGKGGAAPDLFSEYAEAAKSCGMDTSSLTRDRLDAVVRKQEAQIKQKLGCEKVKFRVVVQDGKVRLKATALKSG